MLYEAKSKSNKLLVKIEKNNESSNLQFKGIFQIEKNDNGYMNKYVSETYINNDEWDLIRTLLFYANYQLSKMSLSTEELGNIIWDKFFDSKQPVLIQY